MARLVKRTAQEPTKYTLDGLYWYDDFGKRCEVGDLFTRIRKF